MEVNRPYKEICTQRAARIYPKSRTLSMMTHCSILEDLHKMVSDDQIDWF